MENGAATDCGSNDRAEFVDVTKFIVRSELFKTRPTKVAFRLLEPEALADYCNTKKPHQFGPLLLRSFHFLSPEGTACGSHGREPMAARCRPFRTFVLVLPEPMGSRPWLPPAATIVA